MNRKYLLSALFACSFCLHLKACDACGCAMSTSILPTDRLTFVGLSYRNAWFSGWHDSGVANDIFIKERYSRMDITAKVTWKQRWEFMAMLPYMSVYSSEKNFLPTGYHGIGDVNVMARYAFVNHFGDRVDSRLSAGAGFELPTGKYQQQLSDGTIMHNYQPGSGVVNVIGILSGGVRTHKYGTAFTASYRYNGTNKLGYHRGNAANINIEVFRDIYAGKIRVLPKLMMLLENSSRNLLKDLPYSGNTARKFVFAGCGLDVYYRQLMLSVAGQIPVFQEITHGQIEGKGRTQISVNYIF